MTPFATALWPFVAALSFSAAVVRHVKSGEVNWGIAAAGVFLLAMGISSLSRPRAARIAIA